MSIQNPATHARARQSAAFRYEAARQQLATSIDQRLRAEAQQRSLVPDIVRQRKIVLEHTTNLLVPLSRFARAELQRWTELGTVEESLVDDEDVLIASVVAAAERASQEGMPSAIYPWLRGITREQVRIAVHAETERAEVERSLDAPVEITGEDWPERAVRLKDVLADPNALLPEEIVEHRETWTLLEHAIARLPERWREIFLLRTVDAWDDDEIAQAEGVSVEEVEFINLSARAFLREHLQDTELASAG
jgi:RNA polymerase sigma factor (sigma-70 family)